MRRSVLTPLALCSVLSLAACGGAAQAPQTSPMEEAGGSSAGLTAAPTEEPFEVTHAEIVGADGAKHGTVRVNDDSGRLEIVVEATGLTPGFHGIHLHGIGKCEPDSPDPKDATKKGDFLSSGGHLGEGAHPDHPADLPTLLVMKDGTARMSVVTDRLDADTLLDEDGSAFVIHEKPDNYANIPERYAAGGPDAETTKAGDAGPRVACGVLTTS